MNLLVILSVLLGFSAVGYFLLGVRLIGGESDIGAQPLGAAFFVICLWVLGGAIELMATSYLVFSVGRLGHFLGTALVPVMILVTFRELTGVMTSARAGIALMIVPVLSIVIAATNDSHELMWHLPATNAAGQFLTRPVEFGPWLNFVQMPYGYAVIGTSIFTLIMRSQAVTPSQRRGLFQMVGAVLGPLFGVVAYDIGIGPSTISIVPIIFALMLPVYAWLIVVERTLKFSPLAYQTVFQNMQDPVIVVDDEECVISLNHGAEALLKMNEHDALSKSLGTIFGEDATEVRAAIDTGEPQKMLTDSGRFLHLQVTPITTDNAAARNASMLMFHDVSDVENAQREVLNSEKLLRTLIEHSVNGIVRLRWVTGGTPGGERELRCTFANATAGRYLNSEPDKMIGRTAGEILEIATTGMDDGESLIEQFFDAAESGEVIDAETRVEVGGDVKWLRIIGEPVGEDVAITFVDVTDGKTKEMKMESIARSDALTGVLNRRGFERDAARRLAESADDATGALLFIDLNDFKQINDQFGHEIGDQLLTIVAERLQKSLRSCDIIGRPGGDEFVALVPDVNPDVAEKLASRLTRSLEHSYLIDGKALNCAASIGLALYPEHANTLTGLLRAADAAMYRAKARSRDVTDIRDKSILEKAV